MRLLGKILDVEDLRLLDEETNGHLHRALREALRAGEEPDLKVERLPGESPGLHRWVVVVGPAAGLLRFEVRSLRAVAVAMSIWVHDLRDEARCELVLRREILSGASEPQ